MLNFTTLMQHTARHIEKTAPRKPRIIRPKLVPNGDILSAMSRLKWRTADQIAERTGVSNATIRKRMPELIAQGLAERMEWVDRKKVKHVAFKRK